METDAPERMRDFQKTLKHIREKSIPFAVKATLTTMAFRARIEVQRELKNKKHFQTRNRYTERSIVADRVPKSERRIDRMQSSFGSLQDYMRQQTEGITDSDRSREKHGYGTSVAGASGESGVRVRRKVVKKALYRSSLRPVRATIRGGTFANPAQEIVRNAQEAVTRGSSRIISATINGRRGIWRVVGGRRVKRGMPAGVKFRLLYGAFPRLRAVPPNRQWMSEPAFRQQGNAVYIYRRELRKQIDYLAKKQGKGFDAGGIPELSRTVTFKG